MFADFILGVSFHSGIVSVELVLCEEVLNDSLVLLADCGLLLFNFMIPALDDLKALLKLQLVESTLV